MIITLYLITLLCLTVFSWGFVDKNIPIQTLPVLYEFAHTQRSLAVIIYSILTTLLFVFYGLFLWMIYKKKLAKKEVLRLILKTCIILLFAFPGFSNDIFNYIATAKVTFLHHENPYIIMPIEIPNEPMLSFVHAANKIALYGPAWILLSFIPHILGAGNLIVSMLMFKIFVAVFYAGLLWGIWKLSKKNLWALAFFALNPLVTIETFVSAHNDVVMMFFALGSFYFMQKKKLLVSVLFLFLSILIKYATVFLLPIYAYMFYQQKLNSFCCEAALRRNPDRQVGELHKDYYMKKLLPAIVQDNKTGAVLMLGYVNDKALAKTLQTGWVYFWSRKRKKLWMKGEESGNKLKVRSIFLDCDDDTYLIRVTLVGKNVCHTGNKSCFFKEL